MKSNLGNTDRIIRILAAVAIIILYFAKVISGITGIILLVLAVVFVLSGFFSFCPLYSHLGISTRKRKAENNM